MVICQMRNWGIAPTDRGIFLFKFLWIFLFKPMNFNIYRNIPFRFQVGGIHQGYETSKNWRMQVKIAAKAAIWVLTYLLCHIILIYYIMLCPPNSNSNIDYANKSFFRLASFWSHGKMTVNVPFTYISSLNLWFTNHKFIAKDSSAFCLRNEKYYFMALINHKYL